MSTEVTVTAGEAALPTRNSSTLWRSRGEMPMALRKVAGDQAGVITRKQALKAGMPRGAIEWKLQDKRWQQVHHGVYATFTGPLSRRARLWAAVLYAGKGAMLSHESAAELQRLVDEPLAVIHVTVPADRRVLPAPGLRVHRSDQPIRVPPPKGEPPRTEVQDTILDLCEAAGNVLDMYGWVTKAFARNVTTGGMLRVFLERRKKLRWRTELVEVITIAVGGAHSPLEFFWDRDVELAHGLPVSKKQVRFKKKDGGHGFRDRVYDPWGVIIELDGKKAHPEETRGDDAARDRHAAAENGGRTLRYGWKEVRHEACETAVEVVKVLWRHGWQGRPTPCCPSCPIAGLLDQLDAPLADEEEQRRQYGWPARAALRPTAGAGAWLKPEPGTGP